MRLADHIRNGLRSGQQVFYGYFDGKGGSCSLGAACLSIGFKGGVNKLYNLLVDQFSFLKEQPSNYQCECKGAVTRDDVFSHASHLNDVHKWPRELIADWIDTEEPTTEVQP